VRMGVTESRESPTPTKEVRGDAQAVQKKKGGGDFSNPTCLPDDSS
jgi:hypothetical protein